MCIGNTFPSKRRRVKEVAPGIAFGRILDGLDGQRQVHSDGADGEKSVEEDDRTQGRLHVFVRNAVNKRRSQTMVIHYQNIVCTSR